MTPVAGGKLKQLENARMWAFPKCDHKCIRGIVKNTSIKIVREVPEKLAGADPDGEYLKYKLFLKLFPLMTFYLLGI